MPTIGRSGQVLDGMNLQTQSCQMSVVGTSATHLQGYQTLQPFACTTTINTINQLINVIIIINNVLWDCGFQQF